MVKTYQNKYGIVELEHDDTPVDVSTIRGVNLPDELKFSVDEAEKIALITGNKGIQLAFQYPINGMAYVMIHFTPNTVGVCKLKLLIFDNQINPSNELQRLNRFQ